MSGPHRILVVTVLPLLNKKELEMQRMELLWRLSGTHPVIFFKIAMLLSCLAIVNPVKREIGRFLNGQTSDGRTDGRTDRQTEPIA